MAARVSLSHDERREQIHLAGWSAPLDRVVSLKVAAAMLGVGTRPLEQALKAGLVKTVETPWTGGRKARYAPLGEWLRGLRAWQGRWGKGLTAGQAAKKLGVSPKVTKRVLQKRYVEVEPVQEGGRTYYVAPLEEWRRALEAYRRDHPMVRGKERKRRKTEPQRIRLKPVVPPDVVRRRMEELALRRTAFRAFVLAVMRGLPLRDGMFKREEDSTWMM